MKRRTTLGVLALCGLVASPALALEYCDAGLPSVVPGAMVGGIQSAPSDAVVLFDGGNLSRWTGAAGGPADWTVDKGVLTVRHGAGDIRTRESFDDVQLHVEWRVPTDIAGTGRHRGNSGVIFMDRYEIQILDSYNNRTYATGEAGAVYGQTPPLVKAMRAPGEWNSFDILFTAPRFYENGKLFAPAHVTVLQNGIVIQNDSEIFGTTGSWGVPGYYDVARATPIRLQDHADEPASISFRNIWARRLNKPAPQAGAASAGGPDHLPILSSRTLKELVADPAARDVLSRCVPELVPDPKVVDYIGQRRLVDLRGDADVTLTDEKLRIIEQALERALPASAP